MLQRIFGILQRIGRSFMLPISVLPVAGLLLGIGITMTNTTLVSTYGLEKILGNGTILHLLFTIMYDVGNVIFTNLPVLFAVGVAIGMSKHEKHIGALSAILAYLVMNSTINACLSYLGMIWSDGTVSGGVADGMITDVLGTQTLNMGAFGGIMIGLVVAYLNNRFQDTKLPRGFSFFEGERFVPIVSTFVCIVLGILVVFIWPTIQTKIILAGSLVEGTGYLGTFIYGVIRRSLVPFGLHHVFYMPFWQTAVGGTMEIAGKQISGAQNIIFAQLADPNTKEFSVSACRFFTGEYMFMIFGLPGAAIAMVQTAAPENRKKVAGLLVSAALTSMLTGITEPIEFAFLFAAPALYVVHVILVGFSYMIAQIAGIAVGLSFSGGLIDLFMFGVLQGEAKTHWMRLIPLGILYFIIYYTVFRTLILKFDLKTLGRDGTMDDVIPNDLDSQKEEESADSLEDKRFTLLILGLGGLDNIAYVDSCATRLRATLKDGSLLSKPLIVGSGSAGIMVVGDQVQIIYGPRVGMIRKRIEVLISEGTDPMMIRHQELAEEKQKERVQDISPAEESPKAVIKEVELVPERIYAFAKGEVIPLEEVDDIVFSSGLLGEGFAILPENQEIYSPVNGVVSQIHSTQHALGIQSDSGAEVLIHIGIDTSRIKEQIFDMKVESGQHVKKGELLCIFDRQKIIDHGFSVVTPLIINNTDSYKMITAPKTRYVEVGDAVIKTKI